MEGSAAAAVFLVAAAVSILVFTKAGEPPTPAGDLPPGEYRFAGLQTAVTDQVEASTFFPGYSRAQIAGGGLFLEKEADDLPTEPTGLRLKKHGVNITIDATQCLFLDLRGRVPAAAGGGGAGGGGGAAALAAGGGQIEALLQSFGELKLEVHNHLKQTAEDTGGFSEVSWTQAVRFFTAAGLKQGGRIVMPFLAAASTVLQTLTPYAWRVKETEPQASPTLRPLLTQWTTNHSSPAIDIHFFNTENLTKAALVAEQEGVARYTGVPDVVTLEPGLGAGTIAPFTNASSSWDWKRPTRFRERASVAAQAMLQLIAFSRLPTCTDNTTHPVFFTDMATGVRCWIMIDGIVYSFHDEDGKKDLSLAQGICLLRYFIYNHGQLAAEHTAAVLASAAGPRSGGGGSSGSGGVAGPHGPFTPGPKPKGGGGRGSGGKGASPYRDALVGKGGTDGSQSATSAMVQSQQSSPEDPNWTAADDLAAFELELAGAALTLQACGVDLTGVFDPSAQ